LFEVKYFCLFKALSLTPDFIIVHSYLEVPVGGRPGSHDLSAGGGEETINEDPPPLNSPDHQAIPSPPVPNISHYSSHANSYVFFISDFWI
jgi:hypothetical protein